MFTDPQSITINAVANSLPRTSTEGASSSYTKDDGTVKLTVSHQSGRRTRRTVRLQHSKIVPDPLLATTNVRASMTTYLVVDVPPAGAYSVAEAKQIVDGLVAWLTASSGANVTKMLGGEN